MRSATNPAITAILPAFQYKRPIEYATAPKTITITFTRLPPALLCGGSPGVRKQKLFLVIDINNESVKPATIAIISAIYFAELRLNLSTTIMETT